METNDDLHEQIENLREEIAALQRRNAADREARERREQAIATDRAARERLEHKQAIATDRAIYERLTQIEAGTYYSTLDEVWTPVPMQFTQDHFLKLFRQRCPPMYTDTVRAARNIKYDPAYERSRTPIEREQSDETRLLWQNDIFGAHEPVAQVGHLVPVSTEHASMYDDVAAWIMRLPADQEVRQKAIHGSRPPPIRRRRRSGRRRLRKRVDSSGLKHSLFNKIRLNSQAELFDQNPCVLIVPIMDTDEMKDWTGGGYSAVVLVEEWGTIGIRSVCQGIRIGNNRGDEVETLATFEEIELARGLLVDVLCGLAFSLFRPGRPVTKIVQQYRNTLQNVRADGRIFVPSPSGVQNFRVRKVRFATGGQLHPPPDPYALAVKAGAIWSERNQQELVAHGEVPPDDDGTDSLDQLAMEQYLDWLERSRRPQTRNELAAGLGQPDGYHSPDVTTAPLFRVGHLQTATKKLQCPSVSAKRISTTKLPTFQTLTVL